jgi:predicted nucleic acid-binding Zn finger protein
VLTFESLKNSMLVFLIVGNKNYVCEVTYCRMRLMSNSVKAAP